MQEGKNEERLWASLQKLKLKEEKYKVEIEDFGLKDYGEILERQMKIFDALVEKKREGQVGKEYILIGEHYPVITLGRRAKESNVLVSPEVLNEKGVKLYHIGRGGDVTYHCPGQLIVYPILDLERYGIGVKDFVWILEESVIRLLEIYGIKGERIEGATGVWIGKGGANERKICAIGIKCSRFCTMHGMGLNVSSDLSGFNMINPCGFQDKGLTSIKAESGGKDIDMEELKLRWLSIFQNLLQLHIRARGNS